jgi:hypothetical protein
MFHHFSNKDQNITNVLDSTINRLNAKDPTLMQEIANRSGTQDPARLELNRVSIISACQNAKNHVASDPTTASPAFVSRDPFVGLVQTNIGQNASTLDPSTLANLASDWQQYGDADPRWALCPIVSFFTLNEKRYPFVEQSNILDFVWMEHRAQFTIALMADWGAPNDTAKMISALIKARGNGSTGNLLGSAYKTPYAIHITGGAQHAFNEHWLVSADYTHEQGNHGYRAFPNTSGTNLFTPLISAADPNYATDQIDVVPNINVFRSDNRSSYNALMFHIQGNTHRFSLVANYQLSKAQTWGCLLGELFDYVDGVCKLQSGPQTGQLDAFGPGDYGPSGEDVRDRFVLAGVVHIPGGIEVSSISQVESARPITITNANNTGRIWVNGVYTSLDEFRGTPYIQTDLRVSRPVKIGELLQINPFAEFCNIFNRNNPGANYAVNVTQLPVLASQMQPNQNGITNVSLICTVADCSQTAPITSIKQLEIPEGALGDFFGPGTTVGIPFAVQLGIRVTF